MGKQINTAAEPQASATNKQITKTKHQHHSRGANGISSHFNTFE